MKINLPSNFSCTIGIIGLGYVGLPLALAFANAKTCSKTGKPLNRKIIGFDTNNNRINELLKNFDSTEEFSETEIKNSGEILFTSDKNSLFEVDIYIVTVPTPINQAKQPNLKFIKSASEYVGEAIKGRVNKDKNAPIIIYESTFYPGLTEEFCVPIIESFSSLTYNRPDRNDTFFVGYSPERINPGDKSRTIKTIKKLTSGCNNNVANFVDDLYSSIIEAGTFKASSIKVAEAAKVIENTQRDLNIALINEFAIIFKKMGIDTLDVLEAAGTKWNFLPFKPGLVGGHCIGIDPFYLTYKSQILGYHPELVLAGRRINDNMSKSVVNDIILELCKRSISPNSSKILILGFSFKENCKDIRNTKVIDIFHELIKFGLEVIIVDPIVEISEAKKIYDIQILKSIPRNTKFEVILLAVAHKNFDFIGEEELDLFIKKDGFAYDLKGKLPRKKNVMRI